MVNSFLESVSCSYICRMPLCPVSALMIPRHPDLTSHRWGVAAMCAGAVYNMAGLVICRCFLGAFEAAFGAGAPYFLSLFYQRRELGLRVSLLLGEHILLQHYSAQSNNGRHVSGCKLLCFVSCIWNYSYHWIVGAMAATFHNRGSANNCLRADRVLL